MRTLCGLCVLYILPNFREENPNNSRERSMSRVTSSHGTNGPMKGSRSKIGYVVRRGDCGTITRFLSAIADVTARRTCDLCRVKAG